MKIRKYLMIMTALLASHLLHAQNCGSTATVDANEKSVCEGGSLTFNVINSPTDPQIQYNWTVQGTSTLLQNTKNFTVSPSQTTVYTLTVFNPSLNCSFSQDVTATIKAKPVVDAGKDTAVCKGFSALLLAKGAVSYTWTPVTGLSASNTAKVVATPIRTTTYTVTGIAANGCTSTDEVTVIINPLPIVTTMPDVTICQGASVQLTATGAQYYGWSPTASLTNPYSSSPIARPTVTTTYSVLASDIYGCYSATVQKVTVTVLPAPVVNAGADQTICTGGTANLLASGANAYSWSPATGLSNSNIANPIANPATTTTYTVTGYSSNGCETTDQVTITVNPPLVINAGADPVVCEGTSIQLQATGGVQYSWSPATGLSDPNISNPVVNVTASTSYTVKATDAFGCEGSDRISITIFPKPLLTVSTAQMACKGTPVNLQASGADAYSWSPTAGLSNPNISNPVATPAATTVYSVTGTDVNGCTATKTVSVNIISTPTTNAGPDQTICEGNSTTLNASGAQFYKWTPSTGLSATNIANPVASPAVTTTYTVTGYLNSGCNTTDQVTITVNPKPFISAGADVNICPGSSVTLQSAGATHVSWSPATGLSSTSSHNPIASPAVTTIYTITASNTYGCYNSDEVTVQVLSPVLDAGADLTICTGVGAGLNATGASNYSWSPSTGLSDPNVANPFASPSGTTTYTLTGTTVEGCVLTDEVTVNVAEGYVYAGDEQYICEGNSAQLNASGAVKYTWSPATGLSNPYVSNPLANPTQSTLYTVTGRSAEGCIATEQVWVRVNPKPDVNAGPDKTVCKGEGVTLEGSSTDGQSYSWSPSTTLSDASVLDPLAKPVSNTLYTLTVTNGEGCVNSDQVNVTVKAVAPINANIDQNVCLGGSVQLNAGGSPNYTYKWTPTTNLSNPNIANPIVNKPTESITYTVTSIIDGCPSSDEMTITVIPKPTIDAGADKVICSSAGVLLETNSSGAVSYDWVPATGLSDPTSANPIANPSITTLYTVNARGATGCTSSDKILVTVPSAVNAGADQVVCSGTSVQLMATNGTTYRWYPTTGLSDSNIASPTVTPSSTITYTVTSIIDGCSNSDQVTITVVANPLVNAGADQTVCSGTSVQLQASNGTSYSWYPTTGLSNPNIANPTFTPTAAGTITYTVTSTNGSCSNSDQVVITIIQTPTINAGADKVICKDTRAALPTTSTGATSYRWSPATYLSDATSENPFVTPSSNTLYTVTATNAGCSSSDQIQVTVTTVKPNVNAGADQTICEGTSANLNATGAVTYSWSPSASLSNLTIANPVATPTTRTTYTVTGTSATGCTNTDQVVIYVSAKPAISLGPDKSVCIGSGTVMLTATGGSTYIWTGARVNTMYNDKAYVSSQTVGTYTVTVSGTGANGCVGSDEVIVKVNPKPVVDAGADQTICTVPATAQLNATGAVNYTWTILSGQLPSTQVLSNANIANPVATLAANRASSAYTVKLMVTGTNVEGCSAIDYVNITSSKIPEYNVASDRTVCTGSSTVIFIARKNDSFFSSQNSDQLKSVVWTPNSGVMEYGNTRMTVRPDVTTTYGVTYTNIYGCSVSGQTTVTVSPSVSTISAGPDKTLCTSTGAYYLDVTATGGSNYYTWDFVSGEDGMYTTGGDQSIITVYPINTSVYRVRGMTAAGCLGSDEVTVFVNTANVTVSESQNICKGESVTLQATSNTNGTTFSWSPTTGLSDPKIANPVATPQTSTTYTVTTNAVGGCTNIARVAIGVYSIPVVNAGPDRGLCTGATTTLSGNTGLYNISWSPSTGLSSTTISNPVANPDVTTTYTYYAENAFGCSATDQVTIYRGATPIVNAGPDLTSCGDGSATTLRGSSNIPGGSVVWTSNPYTNISGSNNLNVNVTPTRNPTTYTLRQTVTYNAAIGFSCSATDEVKVSIIPAPLLSWNSHTFNVQLGTLPAGVTISTVEWFWSYELIPKIETAFSHTKCGTASTSCHVTGGYDEYRSWLVRVTYNINGGGTCTKTSSWVYIPGPSNRVAVESQLETLVVYPVPTENTVTLELHSDHTLSEISIYDLLNKEVLRVPAVENKTDVDLSSLPSGIYILRATDSNGKVYVKRIEVKK